MMPSEKLETIHNLARKHISIASDPQKRIYDGIFEILVI
jgi:hypothetical protein